MDFIAVDFETPNRRNNAICAMGITLIRDGNIQFSREVMVHTDEKFDTANMTIHGITPEQVTDAPTFAEVWKEYGALFEAYPIVMHNAPFDASVLAKTARREGIELITNDFYCTMELCRESGKYEELTLPCICKEMGLELNHHNCQSDSLCTAQIMLHLLEDGAEIFPCFTKKEFKRKEKKWAERPREKDAGEIVTPECEYAEDEITIAGNRFVLTGAFPGMSRGEATAFIEENGGRVTSTVSKKTNYVIVGLEDTALVGADTKSTKIEKAEALIAAGCPIKIIKAEKLVEMAKGK